MKMMAGSVKILLLMGCAMLAACAAPPPAPANSGEVFDDFSSGNLRLTQNIDTASNNLAFANTLHTEALAHDWPHLAKTVILTGLGNDIGYYYLGLAAQDAGFNNAARTYYQLSINSSSQFSVGSNLASAPPLDCTVGAGYVYSPQFCKGIVLPNDARKAIASLPAS